MDLRKISGIHRCSGNRLHDGGHGREGRSRQRPRSRRDRVIQGKTKSGVTDRDLEDTHHRCRDACSATQVTRTKVFNVKERAEKAA